MEEHDDWKLGDESDPVPCARCGKRNRPGLSHCTICGSPLAGELEGDRGSLRTMGEAMGARRTRREPERHPLRAWAIAALVLLLVVVGLTWLQTREEPFLLEDWLVPAPATATPTPPPPAPTDAPTRVAPTKRPTPVATETEPPPEPTAVRTEVPTPRRTPARPRRTALPPAPRRPPVAAPVAPAEDVEAPIERPRVEATEKPSLGTDLQAATQAYRQAVEVHNRRVDEYNALADEIQRRNAWDDSEGSVELRHRLDRAREAVESARVQAEMLRARMESVRGKYR